MLKDERGQISFFLVFAWMMVILLIVFAFYIPISELFVTKSYAVSEKIIIDANDSINSINDTAMRNQINASLNSQKDSIASQVDILGTFFRYGWLIIAVVIALIMFIVVRQRVETEAVF